LVCRRGRGREQAGGAVEQCRLAAAPERVAAARPSSPGYHARWPPLQVPAAPVPTGAAAWGGRRWCAAVRASRRV